MPHKLKKVPPKHSILCSDAIIANDRCNQVGKPGLIMPRQKRPFRRKSPALLLSENFTQRLLPPRRFSGGSPLVVMMQAADFWESHDPALLERLNPATFGSIFVQTQVRAPVVIIRKILSLASR